MDRSSVFVFVFNLNSMKLHDSDEKQKSFSMRHLTDALMAGEFGLGDIIFIEYIFIAKLHIFDFL